MNSIQPLPQHVRALNRWLMTCLCLIFLMVFVGGVTRLTESGLSIVDWKLISGTLPPLSEAEWNAEFAEYKATPQFQKVNHYFTVSDFKKIYWLEYIHRLLGRIIGLIILLPYIYFLSRRHLPKRLALRGLCIVALVCAQGTVGWIMVASGLTDQPRVAPIKLGLHLLLAFALFSLISWTRWQVVAKPRMATATSYAAALRVVLLLVILQIFMGALVAGLRAGLSYNTYPLMDGQWIPNGLHAMAPWWLNHVESVLTVQFQHRMGAILATIGVLYLVIRGWKFAFLRRALASLFAIVVLQFGLGIATLLTGVNLWLASAHQLVALGLLVHLLLLAFRCPLDVNQRSANNPM